MFNISFIFIGQRELDNAFIILAACEFFVSLQTFPGDFNLSHQKLVLHFLSAKIVKIKLSNFILSLSCDFNRFKNLVDEAQRIAQILAYAKQTDKQPGS